MNTTAKGMSEWSCQRRKTRHNHLAETDSNALRVLLHLPSYRLIPMPVRLLSKDSASKEGRNVIASVTLSNGSLRPLHISKESKWSEAKLITSGVEFRMAPTEPAVEARCKLLEMRAQRGSAVRGPEELRHQVTSPHHYEPRATNLLSMSEDARRRPGSYQPLICPFV